MYPLTFLAAESSIERPSNRCALAEFSAALDHAVNVASIPYRAVPLVFAVCRWRRRCARSAGAPGGLIGICANSSAVNLRQIAPRTMSP